MKNLAPLIGHSSAYFLFMVGNSFNVANYNKSVYPKFEKDDALALATDWIAVGEEVEAAIEGYGTIKGKNTYELTTR